MKLYSKKNGKNVEAFEGLRYWNQDYVAKKTQR